MGEQGTVRERYSRADRRHARPPDHRPAGAHLGARRRSPTARTTATSYRTVGQFMSTDLFTVHPEDLIDLAASLMEWEHLRHVPVEDHDGHLVGLVTHRALLRMLAKGDGSGSVTPVAVREIMKTDPITVTPETLDARGRRADAPAPGRLPAGRQQGPAGGDRDRARFRRSWLPACSIAGCERSMSPTLEAARAAGARARQLLLRSAPARCASSSAACTATSPPASWPRAACCASSRRAGRRCAAASWPSRAT